ncbi:N-acetyltransferase family protein [Streptomyces sp. NPDC053755]|uniref:GNAT family N-acetyltransferase n=1 Tax=Streptomyces sp. NPDC053755 TaxID=3155815 RepID=UPI00343795ED
MTSPPRPDVTLAAMTDDHAPDVMAIYQQGIDEGDATFETTAPPWSAFDTSRLAAHRFVALDRRGRVVGWTAVSRVSVRPAYAGVVEHSVYVSPTARGNGVGRTLLEALIVSTEKAGIWTIQAGIFPENGASLALHASTGFRVLGRRERVARHHGVWRDVLLVERRSPVVE